MQESNNIIFFYPSMQIGGAELLFARIAKYLCEEYNLNVFYIDYKNGFIRNNPIYKNLSFIDYENGLKTSIDFEGTIVTPISNIYRITDYIDFNNNQLKIFFWSIHPYNVVHVMPESELCINISSIVIPIILKIFANYNYNIFKNLLKQFSLLNSIVYMDKTNFDFNKSIFGNILFPAFLPIVSVNKNKMTKKEPVSQNEINIAILGRLCKEKTTSLINVLNNFNNLKTEKKQIVHIIGDGECKELIQIQKYKNLNIKFIGILQDDELDNYLMNNVDILFAMGTSLLEGAALKLPVVSIPYSYKNFKYSKFLYLHEINGYNVGLSLSEYCHCANKTFVNIIEDIYEKGMKKEIGEKCYEYFINNHSTISVCEKLLKYIKKNKLFINKYIKIKQDSQIIKKNKNFGYKIIRSYIRHATK